MKTLMVLQTAVRKAGKHLYEMSGRWPYGMDSLGSEMWGTMALAMALNDLRWTPYPEVRYWPAQRGGKKAKAERVDLLAICRSNEKRAIAVEAKSVGERGDGTRLSSRLEADAERLRCYTEGEFDDAAGKPVQFRVEARVLLVVNWNKGAYELWTPTLKLPHEFKAQQRTLVYEKNGEHLSLLVATG